MVEYGEEAANACVQARDKSAPASGANNGVLGMQNLIQMCLYWKINLAPSRQPTIRPYRICAQNICTLTKETYDGRTEETGRFLKGRSWSVIDA
jgi:hypothetical protein